MKLKISPDLSLPDEVVTEPLAILAKRGAGKTYTASVLAEEMLEAHLQVVVLDPIGAWWGLRSSADGKGPGYPIAILGGDHGDVPLESTGGSTVADLLVDERLSAIVDLNLFSKNERRRFATDFLERLYHRTREPMHLFVEEADLFAPQSQGRGGEENARMLGAMYDIVRRGRGRGIGSTLITQRSASISKEVLEQSEILVALRTTGPRDRKAIEGWIDVHGEDEAANQVLASLPSLPTGTAWVWWPLEGMLKRIEIRTRRTFDSSATPKVGERLTTPKTVADVDLAALQTRMAATIERAEANDPKKLQRQIATLKKEMATRPADVREVVKEVPVEVPVEVSILTDDDRVVLKELVQGMDVLGQRLATLLDSQHPVLPRAAVVAHPKPERRAVAQPAPRRVTVAAEPVDGTMGRAERRILASLAQYPDGRSKRQVAVLTGYAIKGGGFNNALGRLRAMGYIEGRDQLVITEAGIGGLGDDYEPLPHGQALLDHWLIQLGKAERTILQVLWDAHPGVLSKEEVAGSAGYEVSGGGFNNALGKLRTLELIEGSRDLRASDDLFD